MRKLSAQLFSRSACRSVRRVASETPRDAVQHGADHQDVAAGNDPTRLRSADATGVNADRRDRLPPGRDDDASRLCSAVVSRDAGEEVLASSCVLHDSCQRVEQAPRREYAAASLAPRDYGRHRGCGSLCRTNSRSLEPNRGCRNRPEGCRGSAGGVAEYPRVAR